MAETVKGPLSVLLVEDNPNDAMLVETYLQRSDSVLLPNEVEIHHEENLDDGLETLDAVAVDVVLLDLGLPGSSGGETFDRLGETATQYPVVVLTGVQDEQLAVSLLKRGAQDYLLKGQLDEDRLRRTIRYALERQQQTERLRVKTEQLEVLNRILRHDLRNDLQIQQLWAEELAERLDGDGRGALERIRQSNQHMLELTDTSGEYIEFIAGDEELTRVPIRLDELLEGELVKARSIHGDGRFVVEADLPRVWVYANQMLVSVVRNLLNNAIRHNDSADPRVEVGVETDSATTRLTVADNGSGVAPEKQEAIFGKGDGVSRARERESGSTSSTNSSPPTRDASGSRTTTPRGRGSSSNSRRLRSPPSHGPDRHGVTGTSSLSNSGRATSAITTSASPTAWKATPKP